MDDASVWGALLGVLDERGETLSVAESCTGGLVSHRITEVPGASRVFRLGVVAYSNEAKRSLLGVRVETLARCGAVSEDVAREMAAGVVRAGECDYGVGVTGIAGPGGGSPEKPVGTVWVAVCARGENQGPALRLELTGTRSEIKAASAVAAARILLDSIRPAP